VCLHRGSVKLRGGGVAIQAEGISRMRLFSYLDERLQSRDFVVTVLNLCALSEQATDRSTPPERVEEGEQQTEQIPQEVV
jgi:hypothetical protein